jgi:hypothetical protein
VQAGLLSRENAFTPGRRRCTHEAEGYTRSVAIDRETMRGPARSETPSMHGNISHGSREIPRLSAAGWRQTARGGPRAIA